MTNSQIIKAVETLLIQSRNNYHMSSTDIRNAEYALEVLNNALKQAQDMEGK